MESEIFRRCRARADILKAMAHPTRVFIIEELARGERSVGEITALVGADVSTVSRHLARLKAVGIVMERKEGLHVFHALRVPCVLNFFSCIEAVLRVNALESASLTEEQFLNSGK